MGQITETAITFWKRQLDEATSSQHPAELGKDLRQLVAEALTARRPPLSAPAQPLTRSIVPGPGLRVPQP
jgi:hypothetical protein